MLFTWATAVVAVSTSDGATAVGFSPSTASLKARIDAIVGTVLKKSKRFAWVTVPLHTKRYTKEERWWSSPKGWPGPGS